MAIINPGASVRVMPQAPQINARDFAPDAEGLQRAQLAGITLGKEIADLSLAGDRLKVEKAKLKAAEEEIKYGIQKFKIGLATESDNARTAAANATAAEQGLDVRNKVRDQAILLGLPVDKYGDDFEALNADALKLTDRREYRKTNPYASQQELIQLTGPTLVEAGMFSPATGALEESVVAQEAPPPPAPSLSLSEASVDGKKYAPTISIDVPADPSVPQIKVLEGVSVGGAAAPGAVATPDPLEPWKKLKVNPNARAGDLAVELAERNYPQLARMPAKQRQELIDYYAKGLEKVQVPQTAPVPGGVLEFTVTRSKNSEVVYEISEPRFVRDPAAVKSAEAAAKLSVYKNAQREAKTLIARIDELDRQGGFGWYDSLLANWASSSSTPIPVRSMVSKYTNDASNELVRALAATGAQLRTELLGAAQTVQESARVDPFLPNPKDMAMGPVMLKTKLLEFERGLSANIENLVRFSGADPAVVNSLSDPSPSSPPSAPPTATQRQVEDAAAAYREAVLPPAR
jgi:hypothetical protein